MNFKISIVTVCFNASSTIEVTIKSVLSQTYKDIEYIIVDGKSNDETLKIINKYKKKITKIISEKDNGLYDAMNKGVKLVKGDYVIFLNADDKFKDKNVVEHVVNSIENKVDYVYGDIEFFYPDEYKFIRISRTTSLLELKKGNMPPHQGTFVRKELLEKFPFDLKYRSSADFDFFCRLIKSGAKGKKINKIISIVQSGGVSSGSVSYKETERIVKKYFGVIPYSLLVAKHVLFKNTKIVLNNLGVKYHKG